MTKKAVVLGGTGLLGFATIEELVAHGYEVISVALPPMPTEDLFDHLDGKVESILADVSEISDDVIREKLAGVHAIFYAIGADERSVPQAPAAHFFYEQNVLPTQRMVHLAREAGVKKFVIYGSYFSEFAEKKPDTGLWHQPYPNTRLLQEQVAFAAGEGAMDVMSLRLPYIFGTLPGRMPLWKMFSDAIKATDVYPSHPDAKTAAVTTKQVAQAAVGAMERGEHRGTYPVTGYNLGFTEFYQRIVDRMGLSTQIVEMPYDAIRDQMRALDQEAHANGLEHGISMELAGELRSWDLSIDIEQVQAALGYEDDDVLAAIDQTLDYIAEHE